jgi:hypothetical protein
MQSPKAKARKETTWLDVQKAWFLPYENLGIMDAQIEELISYKKHKRDRAATFRNVVRILKGLKLIPKETKVVSISYGCLGNGEQGLLVQSFIDTQLRGASIPGNYAEERRIGRNNDQATGEALP